jgi:hypothetical protein
VPEEIEWEQLRLEEKDARRRGLPALMMVPKGEVSGIADKLRDVDLCRQWVSDFLLTSEAGKSSAWRKRNAALVTSLETFVDKVPLWKKANQALAENEQGRASLRRRPILPAR